MRRSFFSMKRPRRWIRNRNSRCRKRSNISAITAPPSSSPIACTRSCAPPFFFAKHADMLEPDGATIPYPPLTKDLHHEVELVVAMKSGGLNIPADKALDHIYGYAVGIDLTRRDLQLAARKKERPWEVGKSFDHSAPCGALQPASKIGHPAKGKIWLSVNGAERQKGDLTELIWSVPEIIAKLSEQVSLGAGDIIMTGTPAGVAALSPGDKIECGVDGIGTLKVTIGNPVA